MAGGKIVAVDIGGTNTRVALVEGKKIFNYTKKPTPKTKEAFLKNLEEMVLKVMDKEVRAIGVGCPGPLKNGVILNPPNLPLRNFNLKGFLESKFKKRIVVGNDAKCVALAESVYGVKNRNFIILTLGTGIGGGIIINRKLYTGRANAGELGHIILDNGKDFEYWWKKYRDHILVTDILDSKNKDDKHRLQSLVKYLGQGIASLIDIFDPEIVVLMGGAREAGNKFLNIIKKEVQKYKIIPGETTIVWSKLDHPGILGASLLVK